MQSSFRIAQTHRQSRPKLHPLVRRLSSHWQRMTLRDSRVATGTKNTTPLMQPPHFWALLSFAAREELFFGETSFLRGAEAALGGGMLGARRVQIHCN